jgi:hypothetical protein
MSNRTALSDLFDVGKLVAKGLVGELTDADLRRRDTEPAPPPSGAELLGRADCAFCGGEVVIVRGASVPCPVCVAPERSR